MNSGKNWSKRGWYYNSKAEYLNKLFMRKSGLPVLKVHFPDGTEQPYWNTFYQQITYNKITTTDLQNIEELTEEGYL
jgi:sucrose phosphorylase